jgi:hypothetical protein
MINRLLILLIAIVFVGCDYQQDNNYFIWEKQDVEIRNKIVLDNYELFNFIGLDTADFKKHLGDYYIVDFDNDGDLDVINNGWSGGESDIIIFYLNKNGKFIIQKEFYGLIKNVLKNHEGFIFYVNAPGCCGDYEVRNYKIKCSVKEDSLEFKFQNLLIYCDNLKFPKELFDNPIKFEVQNNNYFLRVTPEINTTEQFFPREEDGNDYLMFNKGDKGVAFAESTDKTGRVWWLVRMQPNKKYQNLEMGADEKEIIMRPYYVGWMSSKYLKKIESVK